MVAKVSLALLFTVLALGGHVAAEADWLDDAWSERSVLVNGNPAISINGNSVYIALPAATLHQAYSEGLSTEEILQDFLDRYGTTLFTHY